MPTIHWHEAHTSSNIEEARWHSVYAAETSCLLLALNPGSCGYEASLLLEQLGIWLTSDNMTVSAILVVTHAINAKLHSQLFL